MVIPTRKLVIAHKTKLNVSAMLKITFKVTADPEYNASVNSLVDAVTASQE